ncbi:Trk system potassium transporter TrkA [Alkaliphilus sp. MSJ-5]|uniref:Trk system potassium transporter TrkA n=1 Tax=Alkaliphilus flagellatus TaxID=2841507 RepID=A0ABS6FY65_9FIRM|nr:Trk system potassium transporter TrkA [Alkaliphilus flagellatus]MBU5675175.1 Trk system potassium transporter TrkA [Alkaliphilus flagellatus]
MKVMIVGAGKLGQKLAESLVLEDIDVTLVDYNAKILERINEHIDVLTVTASGVDIGILKELNIKSYDLLVACTKGDETNTVICSLAKRLGCKKTIARIRNPEYTKQLDFVKKEMGIDHIVNPEFETAKAMEKYLLKNFSFYTGDFAKGKVTMLDFNIGHNEDFVGKHIKDLKNFSGFLITAISRNGKIIIPNGFTELMEDDIIHVIGKSADIARLSVKFEKGINRKEIENVMIFGGGKVGFYLAKRLTEANISVTVIEQDKIRCQELAEKLDNVLVIHGDGTDIHLLEEENLESMDAFVGATGYDEQNLLMALMAKHAGVSKTIAKFSRQNYTKIIDKLGIEVALNPVYITASNILKYIRGGKVVSVSLLLGGDGEVTEIIVGDDLPFTGKPLAELNLPKGIIIGAIVHNGEVIIPNGESVIHPGDRIIIFSLTEDLPTLKMFIKPHKGGVFSELWDRAKGTR